MDESSVKKQNNQKGGCSLCGSSEKSSTILLCDGCDQEFHLQCVQLSSVPPGNFYCIPCTTIAKSDTPSMSPEELKVTLEPSRRPKNGNTGYRGVTFRAAVNAFQARIFSRTMNTKRIIGTYYTAEEAAKAYDREAAKEQGKRARLNFPEEFGPTEDGQSFSAAPVKRAIVEESSMVMNVKRRKQDKSKKKYRGVSWHGQKAQSSLYYDGRSHYLGCFSTDLEAAHAYDRAVIQHGRSLSQLNFPERYDIQQIKIDMAEHGSVHIENGFLAEKYEVMNVDLVNTQKEYNLVLEEWKQKFATYSKAQLEFQNFRYVKPDNNRTILETNITNILTGFCAQFENHRKLLSRGMEMDTIKVPGFFKKVQTMDATIDFQSNLIQLSKAGLGDVNEFFAALDKLHRNLVNAYVFSSNDTEMDQSEDDIHVNSSNWEFGFVSNESPPSLSMFYTSQDSNDIVQFDIKNGVIKQLSSSIEISKIHQEQAVHLLIQNAGKCATNNEVLDPMDSFWLLSSRITELQENVDAAKLVLDASEKELEKKGSTQTDLIEGFAQKCRTLDTKEDATRRMQNYAKSDLVFLKHFNTEMTVFFTKALQNCKTKVRKTLEKLEDRSNIVIKEFQYCVTSIENVNIDGARKVLSADLQFFFQTELQLLWAERNSSIQALTLLRQVIKDLGNVLGRETISRINQVNAIWESIVWPASLTIDIACVKTGSSKFRDCCIEVEKHFRGTKPKEEHGQVTHVLYHPECVNHLTPSGHPECPQRMTRAIEMLDDLSRKHQQDIKIERLTQSSSELAPSDNILLTVHSPTYLAQLKHRSQEASHYRARNAPLVFETHTEKGLSTVPKNSKSNQNSGAFSALSEQSGAMDTYVSKQSWSVALLAAGTVCLGVDRIMSGQCRNAVCLVRPPGHHVGRDGRTHGAPSSGFCLLNNVVIGAIHARTYPEINKYAVIDWDIHHGNGTEELMENDTSSFFSSIHLFTGDFFPGTGKDRDADHIVNVALKNEGIGSGSEAFRAALRDIILPKMKIFGPDIIFISAGFDGHKDDIIGGCAAIENRDVPAGYTEEDYVWATERILEVADQCCNGRVVSVLEGGYDIRKETNSLAKSISAHISAIVAGPSSDITSVDDDTASFSGSEGEALSDDQSELPKSNLPESSQTVYSQEVYTQPMSTGDSDSINATQ